MALTRKIAEKIVEAVSKDAEARRRILDGAEGDYASILPDSWGMSGSVRNLGKILARKDPTEKETADAVCTGIADAAEKAINNARLNDKEIPPASTIDRVHWWTHHTAVLVTMTDGSKYVFDWHVTLNVVNPMIYKEEDWKTNKNGVTFSHFTGFP